jgi:alcohol dehydrogenase class IV
MLGAEYDTHHGLTNAVVLPSVLRFNPAAIEEKIPSMAHALGLEDPTFDAFYEAVCDRLDQLNIPKTLVEIGVPLIAQPLSR